MRKKVRAFFRNILDSGKSVRAKIFILLTIIGMISLIFALIADIVLRENAGEIIALLITVIFAPVVTYLAVKYDKVQFGASVVASFVVLFVIPTVFCFGGGLTGGGLIWFVFAYLYIGIILEGKFRIVMMTLLTLLIVVQITLSYIFPGMIVNHGRFAWHLDSGVSILLVGFAVCIMVRTQYKLYLEETGEKLCSRISENAYSETGRKKQRIPRGPRRSRCLM